MMLLFAVFFFSSVTSIIMGSILFVLFLFLQKRYHWCGAEKKTCTVIEGELLLLSCMNVIPGEAKKRLVGSPHYCLLEANCRSNTAMTSARSNGVLVFTVCTANINPLSISTSKRFCISCSLSTQIHSDQKTASIFFNVCRYITHIWQLQLSMRNYLIIIIHIIRFGIW